MNQPEHIKAKKWRLARGLTLDELAHLSGYSKSALSWFERGLSSSGKGPVDPYAWHRYRRICAAIEFDRNETFQWGAQK